MRFRAISSFALAIVICVMAGLGTILSAGCGSGHTTVAPVATPTPVSTPTPAVPELVKTTVIWPQRSRATTVSIAALASASSVVITVAGAQPNGSDIVISENRPAGAASSTQTYTSTATALPGQYLTTAKFYNLALTSAGTVDPNAVVVGTAQANAQVQTDGTLAATFTTVGQVQSVKVLAGQTIPIGSMTDIQYTAYGPSVNGVQSIIPVPTGAALVSVTNTNTSQPTVAQVLTGATNGGMVQGLAPGTAVVTVNVDNVTNDTTAASSILTIISNASVAVLPSVTQVLVGAQTTFTATVANVASQGVVYSLAANSPVGATIDPATGIFTAPNRSGDTYTVIATSTYDPTKSGTATVTVVSNVSIVPTNGSTDIFIGANKTVSLPVTVTGTANTSVAYTVVGNTSTSTPNGTITAAGVYTAPALLNNYQVVVTSQADTSKTVTFNVHVGPSVSISPHATTLSVNQQVNFRGTVAGGASSAVTYTVVESNGGTINSTTGLYTAPDLAGTFHVVATSVSDPTETDTATITVQAGSGVVIVQ